MCRRKDGQKCDGGVQYNRDSKGEYKSRSALKDERMGKWKTRDGGWEDICMRLRCDWKISSEDPDNILFF